MDSIKLSKRNSSASQLANGELSAPSSAVSSAVSSPLSSVETSSTELASMSEKGGFPQERFTLPTRLQHNSNKRPQLWTEYLASRQIKFSLRLMIALAVAHQIPAFKPYTDKFLFLQYCDEITGKALIGINDCYYVVTSIVVFIFIRAVIMNMVLVPIGKSMGIEKRKALARFAEQGWCLVYYFTSWLCGMYLLSRSEYAWSVKHVWIGWPHYQMDKLMKAYYLIELGVWVSQMYVINIEEKRKDHVQMFAHHIITCLLVGGSYYYYYTRIGHVILVCMDVVDAILSFAKILKYMGFTQICDAMFGVFLVGWISLRHVLFNYYTWSAATEAIDLIENKCYYDEAGKLVRCFEVSAHMTFVGLLVALQLIMVVWLWMIIRVLIKILKGGSAEDNRSDSEDD